MASALLWLLCFGASLGQSDSGLIITPGQVVRFVDQRAPVGVDRAGYVAMVEALARREVSRLGQLIGTNQGFLVSRDTRAQVLSVDEAMIRVKILPGGSQTGREGYLGRQWVEVLPLAGENRVDPKIRALAELREKQAARTQTEQEILAEAFRAQVAGAVERRTALKPVPPGLPPAPATASEGASPPSPAPLPLLGPEMPASSGSSAALVAVPQAASVPATTGQPPAVQSAAPAAGAAAPLPAAAVPAKKGHYCGAATKSGTACKRWVVNGKFCYQHGG